MASQRICSFLALAASVDAIDWFTGFQGASCDDTCRAVSQECAPIRGPGSASDMMEVTLEANHVCHGFTSAKAKNGLTNIFPALFNVGATKETKCYFNGEVVNMDATAAKKQSKHVDCVTIAPDHITDLTTSADDVQNAGRATFQHICPCTDSAVKWIVGRVGSTCDNACRADNRVCGSRADKADGTNTLWPKTNVAMAAAARAAGATCGSFVIAAPGEPGTPLVKDNVCIMPPAGNGALAKQAVCNEVSSHSQRLCPCYQ